MELYALALLPLALAGLFSPRLPRSTAGFFGALLGLGKLLAPVIAKGVGTLINHKTAGSVEKQKEEQRRLEAERADTVARQQWEAQQNTPEAQRARFKSTMQLGRLAGGLGGLDKVPKSIASYYQTSRTMPTYSGTSSYIPTPKKGGTGWDIASGVADALGYLDTSKLGKPKASAGLMGAGNAAAYQGAAPVGGGMATSIASSPIQEYLNRQKK